jgi:hypothetical protein
LVLVVNITQKIYILISRQGVIDMNKNIRFLVIFICFFSAAYYNASGSNQGGVKGKGNRSKYLNKTNDDPSATIMDINNITSWISEDGFMPVMVAGGQWNGSFPNGYAAGVIYQEGIVWGGLVNDGQAPPVRVGGNTNYSGTSHLTRIYRVRADYSSADLTDDAANYFQVPNSSVTAGEIDQLRAQYAKDWAEWPANIGAPYEDVNHDGVYEPNADTPGIPGASQTIWLSYIDSSSMNAYASPPIGLKVNETLWAYAIANPLANAIFKKVDVIYAGTPNSASNSIIEDMYLVQWADPDIGQYNDDYAGCDTTLNLGYSYNSTFNDAIYSAIGSPPPAAGYVFLQGVSQFTGNEADSAIRNLQWVHGYKPANNRPLSTFIYLSNYGGLVDPAPQIYQGSLEWYSIMRGYESYPYPTENPYPTKDSSTIGGNGTYLLPGDPVTGTGWIDGQIEPAGDRRICNITGPFNLALNDTAEIVVALVGGSGSNNLESITALKYNAGYASAKYFELVKSLTDKITGLNNAVTTPISFNLSQNYPNPFNPSTIINYSVPNESFVTIKVFDLLGREIKTLVNDEKPAGKYSITFNGGNLSSGIYFYSITAGSFHQTKKMVLLK